MDVPMSWMKEYAPVTTDIKDFIEDITLSGSKVEGYTTVAGEIKNCIICIKIIVLIRPVCYGMSKRHLHEKGWDIVRATESCKIINGPVIMPGIIFMIHNNSRCMTFADIFFINTVACINKLRTRNNFFTVKGKPGLFFSAVYGNAVFCVAFRNSVLISRFVMMSVMSTS